MKGLLAVLVGILMALYRKVYKVNISFSLTLGGGLDRIKYLFHPKRPNIPPMATLYTYKHIQEATGLQIDFIRKVHKTNLKLFAPYEGDRGDGNAVQFKSSTALQLFHIVKQMKDDNATVPAISAKLQEMVSKGGIQTAEETIQDPYKATEPETGMKWLVEKIESAHKVTIKTLQDQLADKERIISAKEKHFEDYKAQQLQITDGKPLEQKLADDKKRFEDEVTKKLEIEAEAKRADEARKITEASLQKAHQELDQAQKRADDLAKVLAEHRDERKAIVQQMESLEGKLFVGKKRKALLTRLRELDEQIENLIENQIAGKSVPTPAGT